MEQVNSIDPYYALIASVHGITGLVIFITGILQFTLKKGTRLHRIIGRVYLYAWFVILSTGAYIGSLLIVAIVLLGFYLSITGIRAAVLKGKPFVVIDKAIIITAGLVVLFMIVAGIIQLVKHNYTYAILTGFFSLLYSRIIVRDIRFYIFNKKVFKNDYGKMNWYVNHLTRMQFSFITAVGAFTAVQNVFGNMVLNFTLPALAGVIIIRLSTHYFVKNIGPVS